MRRLFTDIKTHWPTTFIFLACWVAAWSLDAAIAIARRGAVGGERTTALFVLTCLLPPLFGAAIVSWWRAAGGYAHPVRDVIGVGSAVGVLVCEVNLVVIFCEDAGISTIAIGGPTARFDLLMAGLILVVAGSVLGILAALTALGLKRTLAFLRARNTSAPMIPREIERERRTVVPSVRNEGGPV